MQVATGRMTRKFVENVRDIFQTIFIYCGIINDKFDKTKDDKLSTICLDIRYSGFLKLLKNKNKIFCFSGKSY